MNTETAVSAPMRSFTMREKRRILPRPISPLESLDSRIVPSAVGMAHVMQTSVRPHVAAVRTVSSHVAPMAAHLNLVSSATTTVTTTSTTTGVGDMKSGPLAKANQTLIAIYNSFVANGSVSPSLAATVHVSGSSVGVDIRGAGNVSALSAALTNLGMKVQTTDPSTVTVEGSLPISQIPAVAQLTQVISLNPSFKPPLGPPIRLSL